MCINPESLYALILQFVQNSVNLQRNSNNRNVKCDFLPDASWHA